VIVETFFALPVTDMDRATKFYVALGAVVKAATPGWSSLIIAGVRVGLYPGTPGFSGLHFAVDDLTASCADFERLGGRAGAVMDVAPGLTLAVVTDCEGNTLTLRG
jgi:predicted enzyme related to lactoylglutathione lyase